jgi:hypothetical protein
MRLSRAQQRIARAIEKGAHVQLCSTAEEPMEDLHGFYVLVHTCPVDVDADGFRYTERVQYRSLFALHLAGKLNEQANIAIGFGGD